MRLTAYTDTSVHGHKCAPSPESVQLLTRAMRRTAMLLPWRALSVAALLAVCVSGGSPPPLSALLLKGGTVVNADRSFTADVLLRNGLIEAVGPGLSAPHGARVVDATGKLVMPGGIETHTHLSFPDGGAAWGGPPTCDDAFSGHGAAAAGGTTMVFDFVQSPQPEALDAGVDLYLERSNGGFLDYNFHVIVLPGQTGVENYGPRSPARWAALEKAMASVVARGVSSFKFFMSYKGFLMLEDTELIAGLAVARDLGTVPLFHAENGHAAKHGRDRVFAKGITGPEGDALGRPPELEGEAVKRIGLYASMLDAPAYIVHVMSKDAMDEITAARDRGVRMVGEAIVASISVPHDKMWDPDFNTAATFTLSPPLRSRHHVDALARGLAAGRLHLVGSDHAAFNTTQKRLGRQDFREIPVSGNGIEERLTVTYDVLVNTGLASASDVVRVCSTEAAMLWNLYPRKGVIQPGSDADVVLFDPRQRQVLSAKTHHSRIDTSLWEGRAVVGKVVMTVSRGRVVYEQDALTPAAAPHTGRFVPAPPFGKLYQGLATHAEVRDAVTHPPHVYGAVPVARHDERQEL